MVNIRHLQFSNWDDEIADIFWDIGLKRNCARVLVLMIKDIDLTSREIERIVDLRQPEVSIALNDLIKKRWICITGQLSENKGRPVKIYHIAISLEEILDELRESLVGEYDKKIEEIEQVREMLKNQK